MRTEIRNAFGTPGEQDYPSVCFLMIFLCMTVSDFSEMLLVIFYSLQSFTSLRNTSGVVFLFSCDFKYII